MDNRPDRDSGIHQLDGSKDSEEDVNMNQGQGNQGNQGNQAGAQVVPPVAPIVPRPQQLANIPLFDGERGEGFINWLEALKNVKDAYGWADDHLVGVAKARGGPRLRNGSEDSGSRA